jgi:[acyl-carrier-protein] S-malonyltransferase
MNKCAFLFPGQGAQYVGMGKDLAQQYPEAKQIFAEADETLNYSLSRLCFEGPEDKLSLTENTQPAVVAASLACLAVFRKRAPQAVAVAGLSLGEYSAVVAAGALTCGDGIKLVQKRGRYMQDAVPVGRGGMAAIIGLERQVVLRVCDEAEDYGVVAPANYNCPGQVVISGERPAVEKAAELARIAGARRVINLAVSAPFHSVLLEPVEGKMAEEFERASFHNPSLPVVANINANYIYSKEGIKEALVKQITHPVLWEESLYKLAKDGVKFFIEVGPGRVLSGFVKKTVPGAVVCNVYDVASLTDTLAYLGEVS